jgi:hypothetical protein
MSPSTRDNGRSFLFLTRSDDILGAAQGALQELARQLIQAMRNNTRRIRQETGKPDIETCTRKTCPLAPQAAIERLDVVARPRCFRVGKPRLEHGTRRCIPRYVTRHAGLEGQRQPEQRRDGRRFLVVQRHDRHRLFIRCTCNKLTKSPDFRQNRVVQRLAATRKRFPVLMSKQRIELIIAVELIQLDRVRRRDAQSLERKRQRQVLTNRHEVARQIGELLVVLQ